MPELGSYGSVRGAAGNSRPYRDRRPPQRACTLADSYAARGPIRSPHRRAFALKQVRQSQVPWQFSS